MIKKGEYEPSEDAFLKKNYLKMTNKQLAEKLNRTPGAIATRLTNLKLRRTKIKMAKNDVDWLFLNLENVDPWEGIKRTKNRFKVTKQEAENIYWNWRKEYRESRVNYENKF